MNDILANITAQAWILALFIRDDGERFLLGSGFYEFNKKLQHFNANSLANDVVELQGSDGQLLAGQVRRTASQSFDGFIGDSTVSRETTEQKRRDFIMFFKKKHFFKVVYIYPNGSAIQRQRGYLTDAPSVQEIIQRFPEYHVALNFEDPNYYEYAEDGSGKEVYANSVDVAILATLSGGLEWDSDGAVWDSDGAVWTNGGGSGSSTATVAGIDSAFPIWTVYGPVEDPTLTNTTTGQAFTWQGVVPNGQTLVVDMNEQTATMAGANVFQYASGDWIRLDAGNNTLKYTATDETGTPDSKIEWNGVVG